MYPWHVKDIKHFPWHRQHFAFVILYMEWHNHHDIFRKHGTLNPPNNQLNVESLPEQKYVNNALCIKLVFVVTPRRLKIR